MSLTRGGSAQVTACPPLTWILRGRRMTPVRYVQAPNRRWDRQIAWAQRPRDVTHSQIFWYNMSVAFTGVAAELVSAFTEPEGFDTVIRAAWSDITSARV